MLTYLKGHVHLQLWHKLAMWFVRQAQVVWCTLLNEWQKLHGVELPRHHVAVEAVSIEGHNPGANMHGFISTCASAESINIVIRSVK